MPPRREYSASCGAPFAVPVRIRQEVDTIELRSVRRYARGGKHGRQNIELNDRPVIHEPRVEVPFPRHRKRNANAAFPGLPLRATQWSVVDPLTVVDGIVGPPLSFKKITSVFSSSF